MLCTHAVVQGADGGGRWILAGEIRVVAGWANDGFRMLLQKTDHAEKTDFNVILMGDRLCDWSARNFMRGGHARRGGNHARADIKKF